MATRGSRGVSSESGYEKILYRRRGAGVDKGCFFFQAEDGIRDLIVTGVQTCALPILVAEYTGLERKRQLRCGRCGTGWAIPLLRCVFCDEIQHENLAYLAPEECEQERKIEVCKTCQGYLKGVTTVRAAASWAILLDDLMTVHLDVAAIERGYQRPARPGHGLEARIEGGGAWWRWWRPFRRDLHQPPPTSTTLHHGAA